MIHRSQVIVNLQVNDDKPKTLGVGNIECPENYDAVKTFEALMGAIIQLAAHDNIGELFLSKLCTHMIGRDYKIHRSFFEK